MNEVEDVRGSNIALDVKLAPRFQALFAGGTRGYGTYQNINETREDGKRTGKAVTVRQPPTIELWQQHLKGTIGLGIVPIREDKTCVFGAIDIDVYDGLNHGQIAAQVQKLGLKLIPCKSKSGGCHLYLFCASPVDAGTLQDRLRDIAAKLGFGGSEIFPKQRKLMPQEVGGWINMPYFGGDSTNRYAVLPTGDPMTVEEFLDAGEALKVGPDFFAVPASRDPEPLPGGPPCLQHLVTIGIPEGTRNNTLLNLGVYFKHVNPDTFAADVEAFNREHTKLESSEVVGIIKSLSKKDYGYTCTKQPLTPHCNAVVCRSRKYGIGGGTAASLPVLGSLTKYDSRPPLYWWDIDGARIELTLEEIMEYRKFKRVCFERLDKVLPQLSERKWEEVLRKALETLTTEPVPEDASPEGQFWEILEQFCNGRLQAKSDIELTVGKPLTEDGWTYFKLSGLTQFLDNKKFRFLSTPRLTAVIRSRGGRSLKRMIQGKEERLWAVPEFSRRVKDVWKVPAEITEDHLF